MNSVAPTQSEGDQLVKGGNPRRSVSGKGGEFHVSKSQKQEEEGGMTMGEDNGLYSPSANGKKKTKRGIPNKRGNRGDRL